MHPIHYSLILGLLAFGGSFVLALMLGDSMVFVVGMIVAYLMGGQTVGRFEQSELEPPQDDYVATRAGFITDDD